jgi:hypothetical protein
MAELEARIEGATSALEQEARSRLHGPIKAKMLGAGEQAAVRPRD